jgi:hypothetical protein
LFDETIVIFLVVPRAGKGDGAGGVAEPIGDDLVDKFAAVVAVKLPEWEGEARVDVLEGVEGPAAGLVEEGKQGNPAGGDVCSGEGEDIVAGSGLSAVVAD